MSEKGEAEEKDGKACTIVRLCERAKSCTEYVFKKKIARQPSHFVHAGVNLIFDAIK